MKASDWSTCCARRSCPWTRRRRSATGWSARCPSLTEAAAEELADLDPAAMRDPRNWGRPAAAVVVGTMAGGALVLVRARQRQRKREASGLKALEKSVREAAVDLERRLRR